MEAGLQEVKHLDHHGLAWQARWQQIQTRSRTQLSIVHRGRGGRLQKVQHRPYRGAQLGHDQQRLLILQLWTASRLMSPYRQQPRFRETLRIAHWAQESVLLPRRLSESEERVLGSAAAAPRHQFRVRHISFIRRQQQPKKAYYRLRKEEIRKRKVAAAAQAEHTGAKDAARGLQKKKFRRSNANDREPGPWDGDTTGIFHQSEK